MQAFPYLLLPLVIGVDREGHKLVEGHAVLGIDLQKLRRHRGELQALSHDLGGDEKGGRDFLLAEAFFAKRQEGAELIEGM